LLEVLFSTIFLRTTQRVLIFTMLLLVRHQPPKIQFPFRQHP